MNFDKEKILIALLLILTAGIIGAKLIILRDALDYSKIKKVELPFKEKEFEISYNNLSPKLVENISLFNKSEIWMGSGFFNNILYYEYPTSLTVAGSDANKITVFRKVTLDLSSLYDFDLIVNLLSDPNELEEATLIFTDQKGRTAQFTIPIKRKDWDIIRFTKNHFNEQNQFDWTKIVQLKFEFLPRPLGRVVANLAGLRAQTDMPQYIYDWNILDKNFFMLDKRDGTVSLMVRNVGDGETYATLKKVTHATNFSFQVKLRPLTDGWRGIFFQGDYAKGYGYYLMVKGVGGNQWTMYKRNMYGLSNLIPSSIIPNIKFEPDKWYYLKIVVTGQKFKAYLSADGIDYISLGESEDKEFNSGGVGITVSSKEAGLYNDFTFIQFN